MDVTHCPELSPFSFLHVCIDTNSSFISATPLRGEATQHLITHLLAVRFTVMGTPSSIKTDNGPAYISRHFQQFLQSFSINHITGIPYNPQAQGILERTHHTLKLLMIIIKGGYTGTLLSSLSRADFTRFQHKVISKPVTIVNTALFVLNFLNLPQHCSSSAHLVPRWVNKTLEIGETNLTGKGVCLYFPRWIQQTHMVSSSEDLTQGGPQPSKWRRDNKDPRRKKFQYGPCRL